MVWAALDYPKSGVIGARFVFRYWEMRFPAGGSRERVVFRQGTLQLAFYQIALAGL